MCWLFQIREAREGLSASLAHARLGASLADELEKANGAFSRAHRKGSTLLLAGGLLAGSV